VKARSFLLGSFSVRLSQPFLLIPYHSILCLNKVMKIRHTIVMATGVLLALLGGLWFLQGSDIVHIEPILCAADCTPITGYAPQWQIIGALTCFVGLVLVYIGSRSRRLHD
jgi:hypothetical protein